MGSKEAVSAATRSKSTERAGAPLSWRQRIEAAEFTRSSLIALEYFPPPPDLEPFVTTYFTLRCDEREILDIQPAGLAILAVFLSGAGEMFIRDGKTWPSHRTNILTPLSAAAPIAVDGPWRAFGASLSPLGWAALTGGRSAAAEGNRLLPAGTFLDPAYAELGEDMTREWAEHGMDAPAMVARMSDLIRTRLRPVPPAHAQLVATVAEWLGEALSPRVERLQELAVYSPRQLQRLVDQYYGLPPKQLARKYRAIRAAALLADGNLSDEEAAVVADQFYDQSHMIREISLFAGRTPARLAGPETPMLSALLDLRNFRELKPRPASAAI